MELPLVRKSGRAPLTLWLYQELRNAILAGRIKRGARLPGTRDLANQYSVSRGTVVTVFEQLFSEGYVSAQVGSGTYVSELLPEDLLLSPSASLKATAPQKAAPTATFPGKPARAFRTNEPALDAFPMEVWARIASKRLRMASRALLADGSVHGYRPLREAIAGYLGTSRGVTCPVDQVMVVSGVQHGLDLVSRLIPKRGDKVWIEDPGYPPAVAAFQSAGAAITAVPVDDHGIDVAKGERLAPSAKAVYVTPAHQFPLGPIMQIERRLALLEWARKSHAYVVEDDYDSEYRYSGRPVPSLQGLDVHGSVIFLGSFNKVLFPSLRLGYVVLPTALVEPMAKLRFRVDRFSPTLDQAILSDFIQGGHLGRHIRRMREIYASRLYALLEAAREHLAGLLEIPRIDAGLQIAAFVKNGMSGREAEAAAATRKIETLSLHRFALNRADLKGLLLGFAAMDEQEIRRGMRELSSALEKADGDR